jgi:hypothetical protein
VQAAATNVNISVRVESPGNDDAVTQAITAAVESATEGDSSTDQAAAPAAATQTAPTNVNVAVRVASPGDNGPVAQTIAASAEAAAQYQPDAAQQQPQPDAAPAPDAAPPKDAVPGGVSSSTEPASIHAGTAPAVTSTAPESTRAAPGWTWNWTWTCGDTTKGGTTQPIDTGISGWVWNWKLDGMCVAPPVSRSSIDPVIPEKSATLFSPTPPTPPEVVPPTPPTPPTPPAPPAVVPPEPPPIRAPPLFSELPLQQLELFPAATIAPPKVGTLKAKPLVLLKRERVRAPAAQPPRAFGLPARLDAATPSAGTASAASRRERQRPAERPSAPKLPIEPAVAGASAPASAGGGGSGVGVAGALSLWLLLLVPGLAVLRLPRSGPSPPSRTDTPRGRPG